MLKDLDDEQKLNLAFTGSCIKGVAHNINTPLSAILGRSEMLQMRLNKIRQKAGGGIEPEDLEKCLKDIGLIIENSIRVSDTIKNAMKKSINAESNKVQNIRIDSLIREELEFLKADMFFKHNVEKSFSTQGSIPPVRGVYVHFSNSFLEIIQNCLDAMKEADEKKLTISAGCTNGSLDVVFHDTGHGVSADMHGRIQKILETGENNSSPKETTESLSGLERVVKLLRPYNARFTLQSSPGDTTFRIKLPLEQSAA